MATKLEQKVQPSREGLLKISDLTRETGVSTATIKFYMREGLLPAATLKTGRNMAYYSRTFIDRIRAIKELQQKRFLPLDVIKAILDQNDSVISSREVDTLVGLEGTFYETVHHTPGRTPLSRDEVIKRYEVAADDLQRSIDMGVLSPVLRDGTEYFEGDDLQMLEVFQAMEKAGLNKERFPHRVSMPIYATAMDKLAQEELKIFTQSVTGKVDDSELPEMALAGVKLGEQLIVLLRRKMLLKGIQELRQGHDEDSGDGSKAIA